ncbi:MAG: hypothetical protein AB7U82_33610 [Blastocatellales bacterium]
MTVEQTLYDFLNALITAALSGNPLYQVELHDTFYRRLIKDVGVRIGDCEAEISPLPGAEAAEEFNARLTLVCYSRITGTDKSARATARDQVTAMAREIALKIYLDPRLNLQVNDARVLAVRRGYDSINDADHYAVANLDVIVNEMGQQIAI